MTEDDLVALQADGEPPDGPAHRSQNEVHPTLVGGLVGDIRGEHVGFRFRLRTITYIETIKGSTLEMKNNLLAGTEVFFWF